jgi:hypothetical protein
MPRFFLGFSTGHGGASTAAPQAGENRAPTEGALDNGDTAAMEAPGVVPSLPEQLLGAWVSGWECAVRAWPALG